MLSPASDWTAIRPTKRGPEEAAVLLKVRGASEGLGFAAGPVGPAAEAPQECRGPAGWLPRDSPAIAGSGAAAEDWAAVLPAETEAAGTATLALLAAEVGLEPCAGPALSMEVPRDTAFGFAAPDAAEVLLLMAATRSAAPSSRTSSGCSPVHARTSCMRSDASPGSAFWVLDLGNRHRW